MADAYGLGPYGVTLGSSSLPPPTMFVVYAIKSLRHNYIYVGLTFDLEARINRHNKGWEKTTKHHKPFKVIYTKNFMNRIDARKFEKYLKSGIGKEFLKSL